MPVPHKRLVAPIASAPVAHATEALRPSSLQEPCYNFQHTSVPLRLEQVDDLESEGLLIIDPLIILTAAEHILV